ncbi:glycosyltransferase [Fictibacillus fluitans]|uniref:Glycosyltransferase n=1 Tax=Fictibacillus fluitans TaxID=3058422 RepID=A0ABT8HT60_9BACL|nr:glycosyltransferase [Fictibacillus sp. NE201]MDN4523956.1 glycosyltransferase [Fictibacillus sp. NE201]
MKTIAYYISEYGFGHATRSIALMREILKAEELRVVVCTSFSLEFIRESMVEFGERVVYHGVATDVGYILQKDSLQLDKDTLNKACHDYLMDSDELAKQEIEYLTPLYVGCILSDIVPIAFEIGDRMNIPTVGISNFTWWSAYEGVVDSSLNDEFRAMYEKMDHFIQLAGSKEPEFGRKSNEQFGFFCRESDDREVQRLRHQLNPFGEKKIVFIPIGMKIELNMADWPLWNNEDCVFVVSSHMDIEHPNVVKVPAEYTEVQNYVAAADLVISKAGWGTVSEAVVHQKPLLIIEREEMNEDRNTINFLVGNNWCRLIFWKMLERNRNLFNSGTHLKYYEKSELLGIVHCVLSMINIKVSY